MLRAGPERLPEAHGRRRGPAVCCLPSVASSHGIDDSGAQEV